MARNKKVQEQSSITAYMPSAVLDLNAKLNEYLYGPKDEKVEGWLEKIESSSGIKREKLAYTLLAATALYFVIGSFAQIICNMVGFAYPAYASVKAIRSGNKDDDTKWLVYWTVFAAFSLADFFAAAIMSVFPIYWLFKILFLLYLYLPQTNGAEYLYHQYLDSFITKVDEYAAKYFQKPKET
ncbi:TB2/DP1 proteinHVA22 family protein [Aphelenchoides avenae]|nr:TB2/DP1 proteinHVA22 family protein [Aphelenchus avenae]